MYNFIGKIQLAIATTAERMAGIPLIGEPVWDTTLNKLFLGDGTTQGGIRIGLDDEIEVELTQVINDLNAEIANRIAGDSALGIRIDNETAARIADDTNLQLQLNLLETLLNNTITDLSAETAARIAADNALGIRIDGVQSDLATEVTDRTNADNALTQLINDLNVSLTNITDGLSDKIDAEIVDRTTADNALGARIDDVETSITNETAARQNADNDLSERIDGVVDDLSTETADRIAADSALGSRIDAVNTDIATISSDIQVLTEDLSDEVSARIAADNALGVRIDGVQTDLATEVTDRTNADLVLTNRLNNVDATLTGITEDLSDETAARIAGDTALGIRIDNTGDLIAAEIINRQNADNTLQSNINSVVSDLSDEVTARIAGDTALEARIDELEGGESGLSQRVTDLETGLAAEITTRGDADASLLAMIGTLSTDLAAEVTARETADTNINLYIDMIEEELYQDIMDEQAARIAADLVLTNRLNNVDATLTGITEDLSDETAARIAGDESLNTRIDNLATVATSGSYNDLINKPVIPAAQIPSDWAATSGVARILNKPTTLAGYGITDAVNVSEKGVADGIATLGPDGKINSDQIPAIAISEVYEVSSEAAMLALDAEIGDVAIRTDISASFINNGGPAGTIGAWTQLLSPPNAVLSVNGKTGVVVLNKTDVGLSNVDNTSDANKPISTATQTVINGLITDIGGKADTADLAVVAFSGDYTDLINKPTIPTVPVLSVNSKVGNVVINKTDVGLGNVDNTSDINKPISTATQSALDVINVTLSEKADTAYLSPVAFSGSYDDLLDKPVIPTVPVLSVNEMTGDVVITKATIGLSNVDNTSDINKPISTATQFELDGIHISLDEKANLDDLTEVAFTADYNALVNLPILGTAAAMDASAFATAAQGAKADTALQTVDWGDIGGDISEQSDLVVELGKKFNVTGEYRLNLYDENYPESGAEVWLDGGSLDDYREPALVFDQNDGHTTSLMRNPDVIAADVYVSMPKVSGELVVDAPEDNKQYARKDGAWSVVSSYETGDTLITARTPSSEWLEMNTVHLQANYPGLFELVGLLGDIPPGRVWETITTPSTIFQAQINDMCWIKDNTFIAVGNSRIYRTTDGGETWTSTSVSGNQLAVGRLTDNIIISAGTGSGVYRSIDGGATWDAVSGLPASQNYRSISVFSANRVFLHADGSTGGRLSTDAGATWTAVTLGSNNMSYTSITFTSLIGVCFANSGGTAYRTVDGGVTWTTLSIPSTSTPRSSVNFGNGIGIITTTTNIYIRSTDNGATWQSHQLAPSMAGTAIKGALTGPNSAMVVTNGSGGNAVFNTYDNGNTWTGSNTSLSNIQTCAASPEKYGLAVGWMSVSATIRYRSNAEYTFNPATEFITPKITGIGMGLKGYIKS